MSNTKMLQTLIDGQVSIRNDSKKGLKSLEKKMGKGFKDVNQRLDKIGSSVAHLEDDTPTIKEFDNLDKRVGKLEKQTASV